MKKILLSLIIILLIPTWLLAATAVYRVSSNEVVLIDTEDGDFADAVTNYLVLKTGATFPDGTECRISNFDLRVLGVAKILDGDIVRNATQNEIDTFHDAEVGDLLQAEVDRIVKYMNTDKKMRRIIIALVKGIIKEDNENRLWIRDFKVAVAASTSLANLQSRVAALDTPVDREFQDAKDYIIGQVSKDD